MENKLTGGKNSPKKSKDMSSLLKIKKNRAR